MSNLSEIAIYENIRNTLIEARNKAYSTVNFFMVEAYWSIGRYIAEAGETENRGKYGTGLLKYISENLTKEFGKGFNEGNLRNMRQFYLSFPIRNTLCSELSWSHYRHLMRIKDEDRKKFYLTECADNNWSVRQLERQINSFYFERLLSSQDKDSVRNEITTLEEGISAKDIIKDPYVLEFLDLKQNNNLYERDLETALINNLQEFLLELGKGFSFIGRQRRITAEGEHFYVDLVFYNYMLKCFVLIDLKMGKLTHQDIGQMDFYVRYYEDKIKVHGDNPTIGIILSSERNDTIVKYSVLEDSKQLFASKYMLYIPTEEELKRELERERRLLEEKMDLDESEE